MIPIHLGHDDCRIFDQAVARARWRIDADAAHHGGHIQRFLRIACRRFLDHDATVEALMREAGIERNAIHPTFHRDLGTTPWRYIRDRRFDVARDMLGKTRIEVWKVGCLVGYQEPRTFLRAFRSVVGRTPTEEARRLRLRKEAAEP